MKQRNKNIQRYWNQVKEVQRDKTLENLDFTKTIKLDLGEVVNRDYFQSI
tara:strand:+ start:202 stop:351 length:150 start_codon:yes stop_codon:yes gene_type:complete